MNLLQASILLKYIGVKRSQQGQVGQVDLYSANSSRIEILMGVALCYYLTPLSITSRREEEAQQDAARL